VAQIAEDRGVDNAMAARIYVLGCLKASVRNGSARDIEAALERYEDAQVGDRATALRVESPIAREVARIDRINNHMAMPIPIGHTARRSADAVLGTMYVAYDEAIDATNVEHSALVADMIARYIDEYVTRLSSAARASIRQIVTSGYSIEDIMAGKSKDTVALKERVKHLHRGFPEREAITARELAYMLRQYAA